MSKSDLVPYFILGSSQDGPPDDYLSREECRSRKKANAGYFARHGTIFQESGRPVPEAKPTSSRFGAVRDQSVCPGERMVQAYAGALGEKPEKRAKAIIDIGWIRPPHGQKLDTHR